MRRRALFALAIVLPAATLAVLGFRALRAEGRAESRERVRGLVRLAAQEVSADAAAWIAETHERPEPVPRASPPPPDLATQVARERSDLAVVLEEAEASEFGGDPARAAELYRAIEVEHARARLDARVARCLARAGRKDEAIAILERLTTGQSESGLPMSVAARLQIVELAPERRDVALVEAAAALEPEAALFVLERLGADSSRARAGLRAIAWARTRGEATHEWVGDGWLAYVAGDAVCVSRAPLPREAARRRIDELARVVGVRVDVAWSRPGAEFEEPAAALWVSAASASEPRSSAWVLGGFVLLLVAVMAIGLAAALRSVDREMRLAQLKSEFVAGVSHELRTPLTSVRMFSDLLAAPAIDDAKRREYAETLRRETDRLARMVERMLDFARLERGEQVFSFDARDLRGVVADAVRSFRPSRDFVVRFEPPDAPVRATVDAGAMEQALHNLFDNAVKYAPEEREAVVRLSAAGGQARIEVADRGAGVDPRDLLMLFERFHRGRNTLALQVPGSGLGLAIVRQIAEAHRGRVRVETAPSRFIIEIPLWLGS